MRLVIPAQAGIQLFNKFPRKRDYTSGLFASRDLLLLDSGLRRNDALF